MMRKDIDILVSNGWIITFMPAATKIPPNTIIATVRKGGISSIRQGDNPKELLSMLYADCIEHEPLLAAGWYRR